MKSTINRNLQSGENRTVYISLQFCSEFGDQVLSSAYNICLCNTDVLSKMDDKVCPSIEIGRKGSVKLLAYEAGGFVSSGQN